MASLIFLCACAGDAVEDRNFGQVLVCHKGKTLALSNAAMFAHRDHGDLLGPCPDSGD